MAKHATELPELRQRIAQYLDLASLKACSLVCKAWHLDFHSVLWERFPFKTPDLSAGPPEERARCLDIITKTAHLFRHVYKTYDRRMVPEIRDILLDRCHGLITVEAYIASARDGVCSWEGTLRPLVERNKASLRRLDLQTSISISSLDLPSLIAGLPRLQSLNLGVSISGYTLEELLRVLEACPTSLECFDVRTNLLRRMVNQDSSSQFLASRPGLKHFGIHGNCYDKTLTDIMSCLAVHSLESLYIKTISDSEFSRQVSPTLRDTFSRLTNLRIDNLWANPASTFQALLDAIPPHQLRKAQLGTMNTERIAMLIEQQHQSLESLRVRFLGTHAKAVGDILATCSKLKFLEFWGEPFVDIRTLIDPQRPWVCTELVVFKGRFGLSLPPSPPLATNDDHGALELGKSDVEDEKVTTSDPVASDQAEDLFMQRLGQLTKLNLLAYWYDLQGNPMSNNTDDMDKDTMAWTLSSGLRHLANLVNLRWLEFMDGGLPKGIGIPELLFFKQHWHNLQGLSCYNIDAAEVQEWLGTEWPELEVKFKRSPVATLTKRIYVGSVG